jgi:hypothetical protein
MQNNQPGLKFQKRESGITLRAVFITVILIPLNYYWIIVGETEMGGGDYMIPSFIVPFYNVIFCLFVILCLNFLLKRSLKVSGLNQGELLTIYILLSSACALCSISMMTILVEEVGHAFWFATPENEWKELFHSYLPGWLTIQDKSVLQGYYEGESTLYKLEHIKGWLIPAFSWSAFVFVFVFVMLCINVIVRKQWTERERLSYPIAQLPFEITSVGDKPFVKKLTWVGFVIAGSIALMNGLNFLYPAIPNIPVSRRTIAYLFTEQPLSAMRRDGFNVSFYPFALGLSFLMPLDLAFSCWFFYLMGKIELVLGSMTGWASSPAFPYNVERAFGATISLIIFMLWLGRLHLKGVILRILGRSGIDDSSEAMSYRMAVIGIVCGLVFLIIFSVRIGISIWIAIILFALHFILSIMVTRMRAELGFYTHPIEGMTARDILMKFTGTRMLGKENLTGLALFGWFSYAFSSHPMPHQLEGLKLAERAGIDRKKLAFGIMFITAFGALSVFWILLHIFYEVGALSGGGWALSGGWRAFNPLQNWIAYPKDADLSPVLPMSIGFAFSTFLSIMRMRFIWWVFHPIGYIVANLRWAMRNFWICMLISSTAKWLILKYGGPKMYRKAADICMGLILGDFVIGGLWNVIGIVFNTPTYSFWPGAYLH